MSRGPYALSRAVRTLMLNMCVVLAKICGSGVDNHSIHTLNMELRQHAQQSLICRCFKFLTARR